MASRGTTKAELAAKLATSPANVTQVLRGDRNMTMELMVKFTRAAGGRIHFQIEPEQDMIFWVKELLNGSHLTQPTAMLLRCFTLQVESV